MLLINKISHKGVHTDEWMSERMGKITASMFYCLVSKDGNSIPDGGLTYLYNKAGEIITGKRFDAEIFNDNINHGNALEAEAIEWSAKKIGLPIIRNTERGNTHRLIYINDYASCTPDALLSNSVSGNIFPDDDHIDIVPLEVKSPLQHHRFVRLLKCKTPADLKKEEKKYYWQVLFQMAGCESARGFFGVYSDIFGNCGNTIEFKQLEVWDDMKLLKKVLNKSIEELKNTVNYVREKQSESRVG